MSEEIKEAYKLFNREDLINDGYKRDLDSKIQVFLTTKEMINYMNLQQKVEQLENIRKEAIEYILTCNDEKILNSMFLDESYISNYGAKDLLNILNKGSENNELD